jgi:hypothetical protein
VLFTRIVKDSAAKALNLARQEAQTLGWTFFALLKQHLLANAHTKQGLVASHFKHHFLQPSLPERSHAVAHGALARQNHSLSLKNFAAHHQSSECLRPGQHVARRAQPSGSYPCRTRQLRYVSCWSSFRAWRWPVGLENALGRGDGAGLARVRLDCHAQGSTKCFEHCLTLMMRIDTPQVIDVQSHPSVIDQPLKKLPREVDIKSYQPGRAYMALQKSIPDGPTNQSPRVTTPHQVARSCDHNAEAGLIAQRLCQSLSDRDAHIFNRVVIINV